MPLSARLLAVAEDFQRVAMRGVRRVRRTMRRAGRRIVGNAWHVESRRKVTRLMTQRDAHLDRAMGILDILKQNSSTGTVRERVTVILVCACIEIMTVLGAICIDIRSQILDQTAEEENTRERLAAVQVFAGQLDTLMDQAIQFI